MTPKDEHIADLAKDKLELCKLKDRLKSYRDYVLNGEFKNATTNKHVLETIGVYGLIKDIDFRLMLVSTKIAEADNKLTQMTISNE
jgi:hypothetical protein